MNEVNIVSDVNVKQVAYAGWPNCVQVSNRLVDLVVTTDVGPRVIRFGFLGEQNEFKEYPQMLGLTGGEEWRIYGGHRFWHAPEDLKRTYFPDNAPVRCTILQDGVHLFQDVEPTTGMEKEMELHLDADLARVRVIHRLRNHGLWDVELAPWALSVMRQGGTSILPLPPRQRYEDNLLPTNTLTFWAYTDFTDPRWTLGKQYILLHQDPGISSPQKVGLMDTPGWIACANAGHLFVVKFAYQAGASYPDFGCSIESYTNEDMLEVETLGPLVRLQPGQSVEHVETWHLFRDVPVPTNDADVNRSILPLLS